MISGDKMNINENFKILVSRYQNYAIATGSRPTAQSSDSLVQSLYQFEHNLIQRYKQNDLDERYREYIRYNSSLLYCVVIHPNSDWDFSYNALKLWLNTYIKCPSTSAGPRLLDWIDKNRKEYKLGELGPTKIDKLNALNQAILNSNDYESITKENIRRLFDDTLSNYIDIDKLNIYNAYGIHTIQGLQEFVQGLYSVIANMGVSTQHQDLISKALIDFNILKSNKSYNTQSKWFYSYDLFIKLVHSMYSGVTRGDIELLIEIYPSLSFQDIFSIKSDFKCKFDTLRNELSDLFGNLDIRDITSIFILYSGLKPRDVVKAVNIGKSEYSGLRNSIMARIKVKASNNDNNKHNVKKPLMVPETSIETIGFSNRIYNVLMRNKLDTVEKLKELLVLGNEEESIGRLRQLNGMGGKIAKEIYDGVMKMSNETEDTPSIKIDVSAKRKQLDDLISRISKIDSIDDATILYNNLVSR